MAAGGGIGGQVEGGHDFAEKKPRALIAVEQQGVLAAPAEARAFAELDLQDRRAVTEYASTEWSGPGFDALRELFEAVANQFVIVPAQRIAGHVGLIGRL